MRQQLLSVINHAQVTLFSVDRNRKISLLEGSFIWGLENSDHGSSDEGSNRTKGEDYIGKNVYDVFLGSNLGGRKDEIPLHLRPIEDILTGKIMEDVQEHCIDNRWYKTRFVPVLGRKDSGGRVNEAFIDGVNGVSMDVTELKDREADLQMQERENSRLLANEAVSWRFLEVAVSYRADLVDISTEAVLRCLSSKSWKYSLLFHPFLQIVQC